MNTPEANTQTTQAQLGAYALREKLNEARIAELEAGNARLKKTLEIGIPCIEAAEIALRADGLNAAADKCLASLDQARAALSTVKA